MPNRNRLLQSAVHLLCDIPQSAVHSYSGFSSVPQCIDADGSGKVLALHRIIVTIREHVVTQEALSRGGEGIGADKPADGGVIIAALEVVEARFGIVIVASIPERIDRCEVAGLGEDVAPGVVGVGGNLGKACDLVVGSLHPVDRGHVALEVLGEVVFRPGRGPGAPVGNAADAAVLVEGIPKVVGEASIGLVNRLAHGLSVHQVIFSAAAVGAGFAAADSVPVVGIGEAFAPHRDASQPPSFRPGHAIRHLDTTALVRSTPGTFKELVVPHKSGLKICAYTIPF